MSVNPVTEASVIVEKLPKAPAKKTKASKVAEEALFNQDSAVQDAKAMQDFKPKSLLMGVEHSQKVKATPIKRDSGLKDCVDLASSTAESWFNPTQNEEWTKKPVSFNFAQRIFYNTTIFSVLKLSVKPKMEAKAWDRIEALDLTKLETLGDIEVFALSVLKEARPKRAAEIRTKLTVALKAYATDGLIKAAPTFVSLIRDP